jgi:hypothetical protein
MKRYTQLLTCDPAGLTVKQLKEILKDLPETSMVTLKDGAFAHKISMVFITDAHGTQTFVEIYDEK